MLGRSSPTRGGRWGGEWGTPWGTVGNPVGRRVGNPVGHGGEPRGARWGTPWGTVGSARGGWGFCTIRSIATACRRRVASLLMQFPPSQRGGEWGTPVGHGGERRGEESGEPPWGTVGNPRGARWGTPWGTVGNPVGRRVGNPVGHGGERRGEESGEPRGARWGARGKRGREARSPPTDTEAGARPRAPPPLNPAVGQVSRRSSGRPSVVPDPE